ncbi:MAG: NAD(+)/NADH kinase [Lachnospiraceae bacterium]
MKNILIIANSRKPNCRECVEQIQNQILGSGGSSDVIWLKKGMNLSEEISSEQMKYMEGAVVIGGDGTLLRAARALRKYHLPLIGVNLGTVGFLCEIDEEHITDSMNCILEDRYRLENRMQLCGQTQVDGKDYALNEVAIYRGDQLSTIALQLYVDGQYLTTYRGDGIVVATPTGSTGYSMSCGGPIMEPSSHMIVVTPIAPHSISLARSIVLEEGAEVEIRPLFREEEEEEVFVSFDGANTHPLKTPLKIHRASECVTMMRLKKTGFLEVLKTKL